VRLLEAKRAKRTKKQKAFLGSSTLNRDRQELLNPESWPGKNHCRWSGGSIFSQSGFRIQGSGFSQAIPPRLTAGLPLFAFFALFASIDSPTQPSTDLRLACRICHIALQTQPAVCRFSPHSITANAPKPNKHACFVGKQAAAQGLP
jgi:hypothetical protein